MSKAKINAWRIVFFSMLVLPTVLYLLIFRGKEPETFENRTPAEAPVLTLENYNNIPDEVTAWYNDNLPFRSSMVSLYSYGVYKVFHENALPNVVVGKDNWLFYNRPDDGNNILDYKGMCQFSEEHLSMIAANLSAIQENLAAQGCRFILFIAPDKDHVYPEKMPDYIQGPGPSRASGLISYLQENTDVTVLYPMAEFLYFREENEEDPLYYHYDTHWNALGAYLATRPLLLELGIEPTGRYDLSIEKNNESEYDLADLLAIRNFLHDDEGFTITDPYFEPAKLIADDGGECVVLSAEGEGVDDREVLIMRDSFADQMAPFIAPRFSKTTLLRRTGSGNSEQYREAMDHLPDVFIYEISERYLDDILTFAP